jgi:uncharacterized membrane protein (UPF0127 family)
MSRHIRIVSVAAVVLVGVLVGFEIFTLGMGPGDVTTTVPSSFTVNGRTYDFNFTATTQTQREAGLMNKKVTNNTTMLFAFPYFGQWQFWMYDTNTSLDIIWVNATGNSGHVVYLVTAAQPCYSNCDLNTYTPVSAANYVIEAKAGFAAANRISVGTGIQFS